MYFSTFIYYYFILPGPLKLVTSGTVPRNTTRAPGRRKAAAAQQSKTRKVNFKSLLLHSQLPSPPSLSIFEKKKLNGAKRSKTELKRLRTASCGCRSAVYVHLNAPARGVRTPQSGTGRKPFSSKSWSQRKVRCLGDFKCHLE